MANKQSTYHITGMTCAACSNRIEKVLNRMDGVEANVNLTTEKASIRYDDSKFTNDDLTKKIEKIGYGIQIEKVDLDISGMTCAACSNRIEKVLNKMDGVKDATVNLTTETGSIYYYPDLILESDLLNKIKKIGYEATPRSENKENIKQKQIARTKRKLIISAVLSFPLLLTMLVHLFNFEIPAFLMNPWFQLVVATPIQFWVGWQFYVGAFKNLRNKTANMDVLVAVGTSAAYFYSLYEGLLTINNSAYHPHLYYETSAIIITLVLFGKYLEARAKGQTTTAITKLLNLQAKEARVLRKGTELLIPLEEVVVGDRLIVKPGEKIPVDGIVKQGRTSVDESMITGESIPVEKNLDSEVIGSTINKNGSIEMEASRVGTETALSSIVKAVEDAQGSKAPIQRLADVISGYFVPVIVMIAILTFFVWFLFVQPNQVEPALVASIAVLVIACPCALGLATPTSIMVGTGRAAESGILFKGGEHIEQAYKIQSVVFDKTGTITNGKPVVTDFNGDDETLLLLASAEKGSEHPLAEAITQHAEEKQLDLLSTTDFEAIPGRGITAKIDNKHIIVGNRQLMKEYKVDSRKEEEHLLELENEGKTAMLIAIDGKIRGTVAVADTIKENAKEAINQLKDMNIQVVMLTGDNERTAKAIGRLAGIDHIIAEVLPEEKAENIKALQKDGTAVAMVGDGINDAPALAVADIGIAIGTGTEIAIEAADITILGGDLLLVSKAIKISQATIKNIKQNLFWAFGYNTAGVPIAAIGLLAPWIAGAAMALSSVSVVTNSLRLKKLKV
ncbi:copper-transporting ATPase [Oceanobacillus iheyensis HTE831]|uniref:Copper-exporting P-type ATPase n=1 Tax=Oceanobacillus iheyensis (strain DSM 14371 / CIP 107618 / JCM 11309 / KCTC 3954 / HTE831) TaxID=221109 RepID=Q8CUG5_OCEIH|nr:heavy metal translocating P-type ATPase [Oceanobacillus iheyensis]BAC13098.1 copper-transporting ATPase [Oceanobacillus iheyensis HTE831]